MAVYHRGMGTGVAGVVGAMAVSTCAASATATANLP
jgi:hypothetical protein